ncbi:MAG: SufE family protein [Chitinophagales bacterium]|nr:SufE family protein [Bacteroidota bacterium]
MEKNIAQIEQELRENFALFDDNLDKYEYIIELGKDLPPLDEKRKTDSRLVKGCQSKVWLHSFLNDEHKVVYEADSDTVITKGIIAILVKLLSERSPEAILQYNLTILDDIELKELLTSQRSNGLAAMIKQMKLDALVYQTQLQNS